MLWSVFWFVFLTTPVCVLVAPIVVLKLALPKLPALLEVATFFSGLSVGAFLAGLLLSKLTSEPEDLLRRAVVNGFLFFVFYVVIAGYYALTRYPS